VPSRTGQRSVAGARDRRGANLRKPVPISPGRSRIMSAVRSTGNRTTEQALASLLRKHGLRGWRRHLPLPGRPDFAWPKERVAVFVDGCFWHGCPRCYRAPRHNARFWKEKVEANRRRDVRVARQLRRQGWSVLRVWECRVSWKAILPRLGRAFDN
jgi:DNA mismatch endonuclease, patch repair protein